MHPCSKQQSSQLVLYSSTIMQSVNLGRVDAFLILQVRGRLSLNVSNARKNGRIAW